MIRSAISSNGAESQSNFARGSIEMKIGSTRDRFESYKYTYRKPERPTHSLRSLPLSLGLAMSWRGLPEVGASRDFLSCVSSESDASG